MSFFLIQLRYTSALYFPFMNFAIEHNEGCRDEKLLLDVVEQGLYAYGLYVWMKD